MKWMKWVFNFYVRLQFALVKSPFRRSELLRKYYHMEIGEGSQIFRGVGFGSEPYLTVIGKNVKIVNDVQFITHDGGMHLIRILYKKPDADKFGTIHIGDNSFIGLRCIVMPGVTIGENCIIGAGSIVTKDIPPNTIAAGNPARPIKTLDEYYNMNKDKIDYTKNLPDKDKKQYLFEKYNISIDRGTRKLDIC